MFDGRKYEILFSIRQHNGNVFTKIFLRDEGNTIRLNVDEKMPKKSQHNIPEESPKVKLIKTRKVDKYELRLWRMWGRNFKDKSHDEDRNGDDYDDDNGDEMNGEENGSERGRNIGVHVLQRCSML